MAQGVLDQLEGSTTNTGGSRVATSKGMASDLCRIESGRLRMLLHDARDDPGIEADGLAPFRFESIATPGPLVIPVRSSQS